MLVDLLSPADYIMVNRNAIRVLGLNTAIYCSELLSIYKKVIKKKKFLEDGYFKVDRKYITDETSLEIEEQFKCDLNLKKVNIIKISETDPNIIFFDIEVFASVLASEDIKLLDSVSAKVKIKNPKGTSESTRKHIIENLKNSIRCNTYEVLVAMRDWIDAIMANKTKYLSVPQVQLFKDKLDDYCNGDLNLALELIKVATIHQYVDCQWAINAYEKDKAVQKSILQANISSNINMRTTEQKQTIELGDEIF